MGDIIAYRNKDNSVITHRVIGVKNIDGKNIIEEFNNTSGGGK